MKKIIDFLMNNPLTSMVISLLTYIFYGFVIGISMLPSIFLIFSFLKHTEINSLKSMILLGIIIGIAIYLFFIFALIVFAIFEKILVIGFKPRKIFYKFTTICKMAYIFRFTCNIT